MFYLDIHTDMFHTENKEVLKYLKKSVSTKVAEERIKYADEALKLDPNSLDAKMLKVCGEDSFEIIEKLKELVKEEKQRLTILGVFRKKNIGSICSILEGASYIELLSQLLILHLDNGGYKEVLNIILEIERLDREYYMSIHNLTMALYAYFEEEDKINKVCRNCSSPCLVYIMSLMVLYYKKGNYKKAREYLDKLNQMNPNFILYFKGVKGLKDIKRIMDSYDFLFLSAPNIEKFIVKKENA